MATPEDMRANAEYIRMADQVVDVPGGTNNNNYANINLICEIAERLEVDAVMPMWGHASENPALPTSLLALKRRVSKFSCHSTKFAPGNDLFVGLLQVTFVGPAAAPMQALGDKIGSTIIAQSAGVPTIAWNGDNLTVDYQATGIPDSVYEEANVKTAEEALACAERIGFPVMIKASEGGGGKGIRKVLRSEDVITLFRQVQGEIPGSPIFVMKMASKARHLEVQLLADQYGDAIALSGRDCSVQRRHQKIIEEGPPVAAPPNVFRQMEKAAVALAKTVGYCNAGTVEYLYLEESQEFAFLELNPRLQVEHPVTENILGINLPACQLQVSMGLPLHRIADIRKLYGRHPRGRDTIDFDYSERAVAPRHCIAVRITAENPEAGFQPTSGKIKELQFRSSIDAWGYFSVDNSGLIHEFADSQFGHIFAGGPTRESARKSMIVALKELQIRGEIRTTVEYIIKLLQAEDFVENRITTDWLDGRLANHKEVSVIENRLYSPPEALIALCGAALQGFQHFNARDSSFINMIRVGQVPTRDNLQTSVNIDLIYNNIKYKTTCVESGPESIVVTCNNASQSINIRVLADGGYMLNVAGYNHLAYTQEESGGSLRMILDGHTCLFTPEYDPTKFTSAVAGKLARLLVPDGSHVVAGEAFVEIEVMKMYMPLKAQESGVVQFQKSEGAALVPGDIIAYVILDNPDSVVRAEEFKGILAQQPTSSEGSAGIDLPHVKLRELEENIEKVLDGYSIPEANIASLITDFISYKKNPYLPYYKVEEALSVLRGRIDTSLFSKLSTLNNNYKESIGSPTFVAKFPASKMLSAVHNYVHEQPADKRDATQKQVAALWATIEPYLFTNDELTLSSLVVMVDSYLQVEKLFDEMSFTDVVNQRRKDAGELNMVLKLCRSHVNVKAKNVLILRILEAIKLFPIRDSPKRPELPPGVSVKGEMHSRKLKVKLTDLSKLRQPIYSHVSFSANLLLMDQFSLTTDNRQQRLNDAVIAALTTGDPVGHGDRVETMNRFIDTNIVIQDLLGEGLRHDIDYKLAILELYTRKIYQKSHDLLSMFHGEGLSDDESDGNAWIGFSFVTRAVAALREESLAAPFGDRNFSFSDLASFAKQNPDALKPNTHSAVVTTQPVVDVRHGVIATVDSYSELPRYFDAILKKIPDFEQNSPINAIHVVILSGLGGYGDEEMSSKLQEFLQTQQTDLNQRFIRRVTFFVVNNDKQNGGAGKLPMPSIFTFRSRFGFQEDKLFRHVEAPMAYHFDLHRLDNFFIQLEESVQTSSGNVHLYKAVPKGGGPQRYFARIVSFSADAQNTDMESLIVEALDHLGLVIGQEDLNRNRRPGISAANHFFVNVVSPDSVVSPDQYEALLRKISTKYWVKMARLAITNVELKLTARLTVDADPLFVRMVATNPTGFVLTIDKYYEVRHGNEVIFKSLSKSHKGPWDGLSTIAPYETSQKFEIQRAEARSSSDTLYCYDWPILFENVVEKQWKDLNIAPPSNTELFYCDELVMCHADTLQPMSKGWTAKAAEKNGVLLPLQREPGLNDAGMVAWHMRLRTPEYPNGRDLVVICNDITFQAGSFGTKEDIIFFKASEYARVRGIPRIFLAANSGARIGMAQSLKSKFTICWTDPKDPSKGFRYIYLSSEDYQELLEKAKGDHEALPVICSKIEDGGEVRYRIDDIIGEEPDLGVENLMGSGLIAGATARAYNDIFTLTLVVGRTVGIGAYLVRLGQRTIQKTRNAPIILTGYQALNKLMGREIYTTNDQLGGPMIMFPNGVSHQLAETHFDAVVRALEWLAFVPSTKGAALPIRDVSSFDPVERTIQFAPQKGVQYDPRLLLSGVKLSKDESSWRSGFFDKNSFVETLGGWAKTVVVGRGRLGGIPMGVIITENRTAETTKPADPADVTSQERLVQQAGGVWFPDSAYKTAQALKDFNRENLPCIIFANWRGFSGGQRDMFDEVLKFGSMIVDSLVAFNQPLFVYIPPFAELRGGAWVVVDSTINSDVMEFYAAEDARGGVLEAAGAASIKFRDRDILQSMHRLDHTLIQLDNSLAEAKASDRSDAEEIAKLIKQRERLLFGVFQQVAVHFADLHDTPGRMKAKEVIRHQVRWAESRTFFYWRLRRRLRDFDLFNQITASVSILPRSTTMVTANNVTVTKGLITRKQVMGDFEKFFHESGSKPSIWSDDKEMVNWYETHSEEVQRFINIKRLEIEAQNIKESIDRALNIADDESELNKTVSLLRSSLKSLTPQGKDVLRQVLKDL
eukprot:scaffold5903_cov165-Ochromonas_danica.AAC.25